MGYGPWADFVHGLFYIGFWMAAVLGAVALFVLIMRSG